MADKIQTRGTISDLKQRANIATEGDEAGRKTSGTQAEAASKPTKMTERERLQASLRQTLTEFQESRKGEKSNGQAAQGGQKGAANNRMVGNYQVGKTIGKGTFGKVREGIH